MILGIDLGGTNIRVGRVVEKQIETKISEPNQSDKSLEETLSHLISMIGRLMTPEVKGIGIGVPSVVDVEKGIVYNVANIPSWKEVHLKDILEKEFKVPVRVNNDSNCFALGERYAGEGKDFRNIIGVTLGTGVGAGIIINGELYCGSNTGAGEIGCLPYLDYDYEYYCASQYFVKFHQTTGKEVFEAATKGDIKALEIWKEFGKHMGQLMRMILYTYDPEAIIIGGGIVDAFPFFSPAMYEVMADFPYPETVKRIQIKVSHTKDISILGAAALV